MIQRCNSERGVCASKNARLCAAAAAGIRAGAPAIVGWAKQRAAAGAKASDARVAQQGTAVLASGSAQPRYPPRRLALWSRCPSAQR